MSSGERSQKPTERRRRDARARGDVARSQDLVTASVLCATMVGMWWIGPKLGQLLTEAVRDAVSLPPSSDVTPDSTVTLITSVVWNLGRECLPLPLIALIAAVVATLVQTGFLWIPAAALPRLDRLNVASAFGRWFTLNTWIEMGLGIAKVFVLAGVLVIFIRFRVMTLGAMIRGEPMDLFGNASRLLFELGIMMSATLFVMSILDYAYHYWRFEQRLMMTVEEVRREQREDSADPRFKRARNETSAEPVSRTSESYTVS